MTLMPSISLIGTPLKRHSLLELCVEAERRGFAGLATSGTGGTMAMCVSIAHVTSTIAISTSIQPIYMIHPNEMAGIAAHIHEISGGRFLLGLGVSHAPLHKRLGVTTGKPLSDTADYVAAVRSNDRVGELPPIILATLRDRMLDLAVSIADGAMWANASLSYMPTQVARIADSRSPNFPLSNMVPTVIDADLEAARALHRRTLSTYVTLPNYRNYWKAAGYEQEMADIEVALANRDREASAKAMTDRWVDDCTISGSAAAVRDLLEQWHAVGVAPTTVMSSTSGGQAKAIQELFAAYS
jgi:alkanesulfonate monooxygenase SsuD/methylene tetrahydromethanopterin reductase-like flavin-dependent oxidoreductase (luciferase family)